MRTKRQAGSHESVSSEHCGLNQKCPPQAHVLSAHSETDSVGKDIESLGHGVFLVKVVPRSWSCFAPFTVYCETKQLPLAHSPIATDVLLIDLAAMA